MEEHRGLAKLINYGICSVFEMQGAESPTFCRVVQRFSTERIGISVAKHGSRVLLVSPCLTPFFKG